jgi:predicted nuclease of predicted toxin-antitoxin system
MRFLADMGISPVTVRALRQEGYDAVHLQEEGLERLPDADILEKARQEERIVLTCDLDFAELLAVGTEALPSVIIFRLQNYTPAYVTPKLLEALAGYSRELTSGAILTVEDTRYRLRRLPIRPVEE